MRIIRGMRASLAKQQRSAYGDANLFQINFSFGAYLQRQATWVYKK
ncbi:Uncharacterised protein [Vibrio cholerae]|uniref:Uncharacterized protein n=1 Tax=Vibrio cholerae TaxID=666 RepID=A0A655VPY8_VIBCL|nr:Uncharacterised protein [Vibrio cholerae]CSB25526.1 Uncharacterised protein [Vibrio cholerae]CSB31315.1 Uncharacterised protein [Vibrio cholerae]CSB37582.1 Uncharacterised protein [Vibrio cholerae]CSB41187.1 Uncharacterised protein [Vibrio cholerae]